MRRITIGRSPNNDVVINDLRASREHCEIIQDDNGFFRLIDTKSKNGTFVNGIQRHGEIMLSKSDTVKIGDTRIPWQSYFNIEIGESPTVFDGSGYSSQPHQAYQPRPSRPSRPDNFLAWSILATIFCCLPFGIAAIVYSSRVDGLWREGDYDGAKEAAQKAKKWFWWSFGLGIAVYLFYILYYVIAGVAIGLSAFL